MNSIAPDLTKENLLGYLNIETDDVDCYNLKILCITNCEEITSTEAVNLIEGEVRKWK